MSVPEIARGYDGAQKSFHWLIVALLVAQYVVGLAMPHIGKDTPAEGLVAWHLSLGAAILFFMTLRFLYRLARPVPVLATPRSQKILAEATHGTIYLLVFVITLLGWAGADYRGFPVRLFGIPLPALAAKGTPWAHTAGDVHMTLTYVLLGVIALHLLGALYHALFLKDQTLARMLP